MQITIDKDVPMPTPSHGPGAPPKYPFAEMEIGDSFAVPMVGKMVRGTDPAARRLAAAAARHKKHHNRAFSVRLIRDEGVVRCWRVS